MNNTNKLQQNISGSNTGNHTTNNVLKAPESLGSISSSHDDDDSESLSSLDFKKA